ncbi:MAG: hypothetical protein IC227_05030 [Enterococcus lacertideformus]|uniref:Uncharacterized protein n=1 Tax=Enterococcus lacertideformus TaxID=2771493 RepID=A0A931FBP6_9ENTE|nr:hypothetical protein [Enterococcus lacertideformus]
MENKKINETKGQALEKNTVTTKSEQHKLNDSVSANPKMSETAEKIEAILEDVNLKLSMENLEAFYKKCFKADPSQAELKQAQDEYLLLKNPIQKIKDVCREQSTFDAFSENKTLKN